MAVIGNSRLCVITNVFVLLLALSTSGVRSSNVVTPTKCEETNSVYNPKGIYTFPTSPVTGPICGAGSCCGETFEEKLLADSKIHLDRYLKDAITRIASILDTRAKRFDDTFKDLLQKSKKDFHEMFKKTYGLIYLQHAQVFSDFFASLEKYFKSGQIALSDTIEKFFNILYIRMFTVMNAQYHYDKKYLKCVEKFMNELKPFGDVPQKFKLQLTRSFVATKVLSKTLSNGASIAHSMLTFKTDEDCARKLVEMKNCAVCTNQKDRLPCSSYCSNTLQGCLEHFSIISDHWDNFVEGVDKISDRLLGPFNIEAVVEPINIKISEAIMNFQESGSAVSEKIFVSCGKPALDRRRRNASPKSKVRDDEVTNQSNYGNNKKKHVKKTESSTTLEKIIRDIKQRVKDSKLFWRQIPYQYCNEEGTSAKPSQDGSCWNGTTPFNITTSPTSEPISSNQQLQEVIQELQMLSQTLYSAHQGQEIDIPEGEEMYIESGSGSGDDSLVDQEEGEDDDRENSGEDTVPRIHPEISSTTRKPELPIESITSPPKGAPTGGSVAVSFNRAIISYVLPIILVWFGGTIADLL
ncbi:glypican-6 [Onthophagus taurus]|uniref:glypican-6 n=1 Tax=Onthophagus taurus TaxID=166361 RepID=UPI000C20E7C7|nr:glypican-6 [Onthophagus taurus]